ncbi:MULTISPECIES: hypothetical protein [unclassified Eikenella]|uniref:hypothetical protein n=1 Tax=unclassified Eikenella TaxID=2639367 RepID=UPI000B2628F2|nr:MULTISPECIES: hypothetical protein [unclassified Eikenella]VDG99413.1 Uncharacterised protein [Helicobacter pametensis]
MTAKTSLTTTATAKTKPTRSNSSSTNRPEPNRVLVRFFYNDPATPYTRATLFERKGRNIEITISKFAS